MSPMSRKSQVDRAGAAHPHVSGVVASDGDETDRMEETEMGIVRIWDTYWHNDRRLEAVIEVDGDQHALASSMQAALRGARPGTGDVVCRAVRAACTKLGCHVGDHDQLAARLRLPSLYEVMDDAPETGPVVWLTDVSMSEACLRTDVGDVSDVVVGC